MVLLIPIFGNAQNSSYNLDFFPDVWYNQIDGVRIGGFILGEMEGEFKSGPHRIDAGVWLGTKFPDDPVSYYVSYTEPIPAISAFASEGSINLKSSVRTGFSIHELGFNKRWQPGFDELHYQEVSISLSQQNMYERAYRPFPQLWQTGWRTLLNASYLMNRNPDSGPFLIRSSVFHNVSSPRFTGINIELIKSINLPKDFKIRLRSFSGYITNGAPPEYYYGISFAPAYEWLQKGISRAKGTIPQQFLEDGIFHISGGSNVRGYINQEFKRLSNSVNPYTYQYVSSLNSEIEFPNPVQSKLKTSILKDIVKFGTYIFADVGTHYVDDFQQTTDLVISGYDLVANAGLGFQFSVNIPDYLGKDRGFAIRYELPFWLSDPVNESNFKFRNLIGIGAVISL